MTALVGRSAMDDATLERLLANATPGPWDALSWEEDAGGTDWNVWGPKSSSFPLDHDFRGDFGNGADAKLMALSKDLAAEVLRLRAAAKGLADALDAVESANARVCRGRTKAAYHQIIADGQGGDLDALDDARYDARAALSAFNATQEGV